MPLVPVDTDNVSFDTSQALTVQSIVGLIAGEAISCAAPCYIKASDGKVYNANGTAADVAAKVRGFSSRNARVGQPLTLFGRGARFHYSAAGLIPGADLFLGTTAGRLDTAATVGGTAPIAFAVTSSDIIVGGL